MTMSGTRKYVDESRATKLTPRYLCSDKDGTMRTTSSLRLAFYTTAIVVSAYVFADVPATNDELTRMFNEDQSDRAPAANGKPLNWILVSQRDRARRERALALYRSGALKTG